MNLSYKLQGTKAIKKLAIRIYHNKLDISVAMAVMLMDHEWDSVSQTVIDNSELNIAIQGLKLDILKQYNKDFCKGVLINKIWLQKVIKTSFMRPKMENGLVSPDYTIYVSDFASWWLDNYSQAWKVSHKKLMDDGLRNQYKKFVKILKEYETVVGEKLQLRNVMISDLNSFVEYLETENYQISTVERQLGRFRFFLNRALEHNIDVNQSFKQRIYLDKEDDFEGVYLNKVEIQKIIDKDFSYDYDLNVAKQNFLIGLFTGLRISDFLKLDVSNISDGNFTVKTTKTKAKVVIPIHNQVEKILNENFGCLPQKISSSEFNKQIKIICQVCEIDNLVYGKVFDKDLKRKKIGYYKKYLLISSHVCRRSYATNFASVGSETLNSVMGWSKDSKMGNHYNKTSKVEHANEMRKQYNAKN